MAKHLVITLLGALILCGISLAQSTPSAEPASQTQAQSPASQAPTGAAAQPGSPRIAPGNVIPVQLTKTVDAKKAKPGDEVTAKVTMDLKNNRGDVIVPKDTAVIGHVTEAQARTKEQKESQLGITFDQAKLKTGDMQMPMSIQAVIALPTTNSSDSGNGAPAQAGGATSGASPSSMAGRAGSPSGAAPPQQSQSATPTATTGPVGGADTQPSDNAHPAITGNTQGVVGIPNLKLEANAQNSTPAQQGSVLSSDKNNVKLESGTLMLLRVDPSTPQTIQAQPNQSAPSPNQPNQ
jgi:hypothetical protein